MATFLPAVLRGGVDVVQLRDKDCPTRTNCRWCALMQPICRDFGVPFIVNDSPELALTSAPTACTSAKRTCRCARCRELLGDDAIVGLSTHSTDEFDARARRGRQLLQRRARSSRRRPSSVVPAPGSATRSRASHAALARCSSPAASTRTTSPRSSSAGLRHFVVVRALTESSRPARSHARESARGALTRRSQRWRSSQPKSVATIRGSARSWWPAPWMRRSSARPSAAATRSRASEAGTSRSSVPCPMSSRRGGIFAIGAHRIDREQVLR